MKIYKKKNKKTLIIGIVGAIIVCAAAYLVFASIKKLPPFAAAKQNVDQSGQTVNLERTDTEKAATKALQDNPNQKTQNTQNDTPSQPTSTDTSGKKVVNVLLTNAGITNGTVSASGVVTNVTESDGQCSYVFTNGTDTVTKTSQTLVNPTSTTCATVSFSSSELPTTGTWAVKINYTSNTSTGASNTVDFTK